MNFNTQTRLTASKSDHVTIGEFTESLLKVIVYKNENDESVGLSYNEILTNVKATFPNNKTSYQAIAGYATKLRKEGEDLPKRVRKNAASLYHN